MQVRTCLWFDGRGREAAEFYVAIVPGSSVESTGSGPMVLFNLGGTPFTILDGGPMHKPTPAASIAVSTLDQDETDRLWGALTSDGGKEGRCGWCVDKFGVSWQVVPKALPRLMGSDDREGADRVMKAMMRMTKIIVKDLEAAFAGEGA